MRTDQGHDCHGARWISRRRHLAPRLRELLSADTPPRTERPHVCGPHTLLLVRTAAVLVVHPYVIRGLWLIIRWRQPLRCKTRSRRTYGLPAFSTLNGSTPRNARPDMNSTVITGTAGRFSFVHVALTINFRHGTL